jgi:hypothetical protein
MARRSLSAVAERPIVAVCAGKDCRKRGEFAKLRDALDEQCDVTELKCVGLCNGPVVVLDPQGAKPAVYSKLRSKRHRKLLLAVATGDARARRDLSNRRVSTKKVISGVSRQAKRRLVVTSRAA